MNFKIDEKATIGSILDALKIEGVKTGDIAKTIEGISEKPLRNALKQAGYEFQNKIPKGWYYTKDDEQPLNKSIFDYVNKGNTKAKSSSPRVTQGNTEVKDSSSKVIQGNTEVKDSSPKVIQGNTDFTLEEKQDLIEMLQEWRANKTQKNPKTVHERIKTLPSGTKTRKTIVINEEIGKHLDEYCKIEKVNKSDIIHLALMDFLNKHQH